MTIFSVDDGDYYNSIFFIFKNEKSQSQIGQIESIFFKLPLWN